MHPTRDLFRLVTDPSTGGGVPVVLDRAELASLERLIGHVTNRIGTGRQRIIAQRCSTRPQGH